MIHFRSFLNTDPPLLVEIWRQHTRLRSQVSEINRLTLDHHVFSKPYFDPAGLLLAIESIDGHDRPLGFVHAAFLSNDSGSDFDLSRGLIAQLKLLPGDQQAAVASELLQRACDYLVGKGAEAVHFGGDFSSQAPFYLGLYGGSRIPGVTGDDVEVIEALQQAGFESTDRIIVMQRELADFRTPVGRSQMALRRQYQVNSINDPLDDTWWENCTLGMTERERFSIYHKTDQTVYGSVCFWDMKPLADDWNALARGMYNLRVPTEFRRSGIATFLVGESLRYLMQQGISVVEAQSPVSDPAAIGVFAKLGFKEVGFGFNMRKSL